MKRSTSWIALALGLALGCGTEAPVGEGAAALRTLEQVSSFGSNPGGLSMYVHSPSDLPAGPRPVVVALHGCTMNAAGYADAGWNDLADEMGFHVIYPQQNSATNNSLSCFNWGGSWPGTPSGFVASSTPLNTSDIERGGPEVSSIVSMVEHVVASRNGDASRVYVTGLSAGGGMTAVLLAAYPDVFAGGQVIAGIPYGCATERATTGEANACIKAYTGLNAYLDRTPAEWAALVSAVAPAGAAKPKVSIWHGTSDFVVDPGTSAELVEQWTAVHGASASGSETVDGATRETWSVGGDVVVENWTIPGMGHAAPVDPASGCGSTGSYISDVGVCSARLAATFFGLDGAAGPVDPPVVPGAPAVAFVMPAAGAFVDGVVDVEVDATDADGIASVDFFVDDVALASLSSAPWAVAWDTTPLAEGSHELRAVATDTTGVEGSAMIQLVVDRPGGIVPDPVDMGAGTPMPDGGVPTTPGADAGVVVTPPVVVGCAVGGRPGSLVGLVGLALLALRRRRQK